MGADNKTEPHSKDNRKEYVFVCRRYPELRVVYKRREKPGETEKYIGFRRHSIGGVFETNDGAIAKYLRGMDIFQGLVDSINDANTDGTIAEMDHDDLTKALMQAEPEPDKVHDGPVGTAHGEAPARPAAPVEAGPPAEPKAARSLGLGVRR